MFTKDTICEEIKSLIAGPVTSGNVRDLAGLLYIKKHCSELEKVPKNGPDTYEGKGLTRELAMEWLQRMQNADGTTGPHWSIEQTEDTRAKYGVNCDPLAWNVAMNMIYSDYAKVAEKVNANSMDFYAYMAKAFLKDKDSRNQGGETLARYYEYVVL